MHAYLSNPLLKSHVLSQLALHREQDKLIKGSYWEDGKGCAVGCTLESVRLFNGHAGKPIDHRDHGLYETELGIPRIIARLEDYLFESLDNGASQAWPERFAAAIMPGADLTMVWPRFALWLLTEELPLRTTNHPQCTTAIADVAALYREWVDTSKKPELKRWQKARSAAACASYAAAAAANAAYAASYVANAAAAAAAANAANAAARQSCIIRMADKLIELLGREG